MENKKNLLVTLADKKYIQQAKQLFSSVYWNAGWEGDYMLLSHEIPEEDLRWFRDKGILVRQCHPLHKESVTYVFSPVVLDKFYLFTEEFKKWNKIVFLDLDIIVKGSLKRLTRIKYMGAVQDVDFNDLYTHFFDPVVNKFDDKTYNLSLPAFNSGVFSFNTKIITPSMFDELNTFFHNHVHKFKYLDQATFNLYFYKKWKKFPLIYNMYMAYQCFKLPDKLKCILLHFITCPDHFKVWDPKNPYYQEWKANLDRAEFIDLNKIQKVEKWNILKEKYYNTFLKIFLFKYIGKYRLKKIFYIEKLRNFFIYKFPNIIYLPDMLMGKIGSWLIKVNPALYHKLKKLKVGK